MSDDSFDDLDAWQEAWIGDSVSNRSAAPTIVWNGTTETAARISEALPDGWSTTVVVNHHNVRYLCIFASPAKLGVSHSIEVAPWWGVRVDGDTFSIIPPVTSQQTH